MFPTGPTVAEIAAISLTWKLPMQVLITYACLIVLTVFSRYVRCVYWAFSRLLDRKAVHEVVQRNVQ